jgi:hypothetical protein
MMQNDTPERQEISIGAVAAGYAVARNFGLSSFAPRASIRTWFTAQWQGAETGSPVVVPVRHRRHMHQRPVRTANDDMPQGDGRNDGIC